MEFFLSSLKVVAKVLVATVLAVVMFTVGYAYITITGAVSDYRCGRMLSFVDRFPAINDGALFSSQARQFDYMITLAVYAAMRNGEVPKGEQLEDPAYWSRYVMELDSVCRAVPTFRLVDLNKVSLRRGAENPEQVTVDKLLASSTRLHPDDRLKWVANHVGQSFAEGVQTINSSGIYLPAVISATVPLASRVVPVGGAGASVGEVAVPAGEVQPFPAVPEQPAAPVVPQPKQSKEPAGK